MKLLIFGFTGTNTEYIARHMPLEAHKVYLPSTLTAIEGFVRDTDFSAYDYVLGMGVYSGRDQEAIRIETICTSQFRNQKGSVKERAIPYFLQPTAPFKLAAGMGNSWCNLVSFKILSTSPACNYTFLHIPKRLDTTVAMSAVKRQLQNI